ncbi:hypothetical protein SAVIM40S_00023 [Streptomyces avidinii]
MEIALAHTGELIVVGVSRTGRIAVHAQPAELGLRSPLLHGRPPAQETALPGALLDDERRTRLLRLLTLRTARTAAEQGGQQQDGAVFAQDAFGSQESAPQPAGEWSFAAHLVLDRYLVGEAHGPRR